MQTLDDGEEVVLRVPTSERIGKDVANGKIDSLLIQVVLEYDETGVKVRGGFQDGIEVLHDLVDGLPGWDVPVFRVELLGRGGASPHNGRKLHGLADGADTIIDVAVRGSHSVRGDAGDLPDSLPCPA